MNDLKDKLSQVKDDHAAEAVDRRGAEFDEKAKMDAAFMLGRVWQNETIAEAIYSNLASQSILALERFQEEKRFKALGFDTFDQMLNEHPMSKIKKSQFYERRALIKKHGPEIYDLLTSVGIGVRSQKMLGSGDLSISGDKLMVGDQEVELSNSSLIKDVLSEMFDEKRELQTKLTKAENKVVEKQAQIDLGIAENQQLTRNIDAITAANPYERALSRAAVSLLELSEVAGELPDKLKATRGQDAIAVLWTAIQRVKAAHGVSFNFEDKPSPQSENLLDDIARQVLADDDELDD